MNSHSLSSLYPVEPDHLQRLHTRLEKDAQANDLLDIAYRTVDSAVGPLLLAATPLLAANAHRLPAAAWPRLAAAIAVAVLPLPAILFVGWHALEAANRLLSSVLPATLSFYLVATHAAVLALLLGLTYGAVPLLAAHQLRLQHEDTHV